MDSGCIYIFICIYVYIIKKKAMNLRETVGGVGGCGGSGGRRNEVKTVCIYEKVTCKMSRKHKSHLRNIFTKEMIIRRKGISIVLLFGN